MLSAFSIRMIGLSISFYLNVYLAERLLPNELGGYYTLTQLLLLLSVFYRTGLDVVLLKYSSVLSIEKLNKLIIFLIKKGLVYYATGSLILIMILPIALNYLSSEVVLFSLLSLVPYSLSLLIAEYLKGRNYQNKAAMIQSAVIPLLTLSVFNFTHLGIIKSYFVSVIICAFIAILWLYKPAKTHKGVLKESKDTFKSILESQRIFFTVSLLNVIMATADTICLSIMTNSDEVAIYGVASRIALLSSIVLVAVNGVIGPRFSQYWVANDIKGLREEFKKSTIGLLILAVLIFLTTLYAAEHFILVFFSSNYSASYPILIILTFGQLITLSTGPVAYGLMMTKMSHLHRRSLYFAVSSNILLNIILIPLYGAMGAAVATAISLTIKNIYSFTVFIKFISSKVGKNENKG